MPIKKAENSVHLKHCDYSYHVKTDQQTNRQTTDKQIELILYIVACQAHPALVKIGPVLAPSFQLSTAKLGDNVLGSVRPSVSQRFHG